MAEVGRPLAIDDSVLRKLEDGFLQWFSIQEACRYANIASSTYYLYVNEHPEFSERAKELKHEPRMRAKMNIAQGLKKGNIPLSQWYLEKRDKQFAPQKKDDIPQINIFQILGQIKEQNGQLARGQIREISEPVLAEGQRSQEEIISDEQSAEGFQFEETLKKLSAEVTPIRDDNA